MTLQTYQDPEAVPFPAMPQDGMDDQMDLTPFDEEASSPTLDMEELESLLYNLILLYDQEDEVEREAQLRLWVRNDLFIRGITNIYYSTISRDYRTVNELDAEEDYDPDLEDKVVNLLKPYRESIVAALSVGLPVTRFYPEDADNADDILAAQTWSKAADLIRRKNRAKGLFIRALSTFWTEGFVACYNYADTDEKYGVTEVPKIEQQTVFNHTAYCPDCGAELAQGQSQDPIPDDQGPVIPCPDCGQNVQTLVESQPGVQDVTTGYDSIPKTKECLKIYGGRYVQVAPYARDVTQTPYLILNEEFHLAQMKHEYQDHADDLGVGSDRQLFDRWARLGFRYRSDYAAQIVTKRQAWFHNWAFRLLDPDNADLLLKLYPNGCKATFVGDILVEMKDEKMEDHWTVAQDPQEDFVHAEPPMNASVPVQEMYSEATQLTLETMRYSISETFIDSSILDLKKYKLSEIRPGTVTPVKAPIGGNLSNSITSSKPATLSQEVNIFKKSLQEDGQFTSGAFPSIYGGQIQAGSDTAAEYSMSRAQAMQRLQLTYQIMAFFWADLEGRAVKDFLNNLRTDQKDTVAQSNDTFISVWIKKSDYTGTVGNIEPENSEQFPTSWAQKRDALYQLIQLNNDFINEALFHPENRSYVAETLGLPDLFIPGEEDRVKQLYEIMDLIKGAPLDPQGMMPSIPIDPDLDQDDVHIGVLKAWLISPVGLYVKQDNPPGFANCMAHLKMHMMHAAQMAQQAMQAQAMANGQPGDKKNDKAGPSNNLPAPE